MTHCVVSKEIEHLSLIDGRYFETLHHSEEQDRKIDSIDIHEAYNGSTWLISNDEANDIALLHIQSSNPFKLTDLVLPIELPGKQNWETQSTLILSGWGLPRPGNPPGQGDGPEYVILDPISDEKCQSLHPEMTIRETML
ncbi:uncharacterized protein LOC110860305 [Folsomia candida]|uniref:uncharacterized protein LOC110860305 n=1 Tax=Folsomia candida TaxID=158441 RepID=UPI000B9090B5|nr:uncharacterized protein LOC110860305 [Folsomia candida]